MKHSMELSNSSLVIPGVNTAVARTRKIKTAIGWRNTKLIYLFMIPSWAKRRYYAVRLLSMIWELPPRDDTKRLNTIWNTRVKQFIRKIPASINYFFLYERRFKNEHTSKVPKFRPPWFIRGRFYSWPYHIITTSYFPINRCQIFGILFIWIHWPIPL